MRKYLLPKDGTFYKANLHSHSTVSDGGLTPEELKKRYKEHGYSIVAYTDHEIMVPHNDLSDDEFLAITSTELSTNYPSTEGEYVWIKCYHINFYAKDRNAQTFPGFKREYIWRENTKEYITDAMVDMPETRIYDTEAINLILKRAKEQGFLTCLNHPVWSLQEYPDVAFLENLWGVEVFNYGCYVDGNEDTTFAYDNLLRKGQLVCAVSSDDCHSPVDRDMYGGWNMIKAKSLDYDEVYSAMERGDLYASTGPSIEELYIEDGILTVKCSPARQVTVNTERRNAPTINDFDNGGELITEIIIDLNDYINQCCAKKDCMLKTPYIRVRIEDAQGRHAWTRPYTLDEITD